MAGFRPVASIFLLLAGTAIVGVGLLVNRLRKRHKQGFPSPMEMVARGLTSIVNDLGPWTLSDLTLGLAALAKVTEKEPPLTLGSEAPDLSQDPYFLLEAQHWRSFAEAIYADDQVQWSMQTGLPESAIVAASFTSHPETLRPAYVVAVDAAFGAVVLAVRGTRHYLDVLVDAAAAPTRFQGGWCHSGFVHAAKLLMDEVEAPLKQAIHDYPTFDFLCTGHSLGAGTAVMCGLLLQEAYPYMQCWAFCPPACVDHRLSHLCRSFTVSIMAQYDLVPRFSVASVELLRERICNFDWDKVISLADHDDEWKMIAAAATAMKKLQAVQMHASEKLQQLDQVLALDSLLPSPSKQEGEKGKEGEGEEEGGEGKGGAKLKELEGEEEEKERERKAEQRAALKAVAAAKSARTAVDVRAEDQAPLSLALTAETVLQNPAIAAAAESGCNGHAGEGAPAAAAAATAAGGGASAGAGAGAAAAGAGTAASSAGAAAGGGAAGAGAGAAVAGAGAGAGAGEEDAGVEVGKEAGKAAEKEDGKEDSKATGEEAEVVAEEETEQRGEAGGGVGAKLDVMKDGWVPSQPNHPEEPPHFLEGEGQGGGEGEGAPATGSGAAANVNGDGDGGSGGGSSSSGSGRSGGGDEGLGGQRGRAADALGDEDAGEDAEEHLQVDDARARAEESLLGGGERRGEIGRGEQVDEDEEGGAGQGGGPGGQGEEAGGEGGAPGGQGWEENEEEKEAKKEELSAEEQMEIKEDAITAATSAGSKRPGAILGPMAAAAASAPEGAASVPEEGEAEAEGEGEGQGVGGAAGGENGEAAEDARKGVGAGPSELFESGRGGEEGQGKGEGKGKQSTAAALLLGGGPQQTLPAVKVGEELEALGRGEEGLTGEQKKERAREKLSEAVQRTPREEEQAQQSSIVAMYPPGRLLVLSSKESSKKKEPIMRIKEPYSRRYGIFNSYAEARNITWSLREAQPVDFREIVVTGQCISDHMLGTISEGLHHLQATCPPVKSRVRRPRPPPHGGSSSSLSDLSTRSMGKSDSELSGSSVKKKSNLDLSGDGGRKKTQEGE